MTVDGEPENNSRIMNEEHLVYTISLIMGSVSIQILGISYARQVG